MPLSDLVKQKVISCRTSSSIRDVADIMKTHDVGAVLVCDEAEKPLGIITDRDIVLRCISEQLPVTTSVDKVMSKSVHCAKLEDGIQDVIQLMRDNEIRRIPVVDHAGKAIGLISFGDVVGLLAKELSDISSNTPVDVAA